MGSRRTAAVRGAVLWGFAAFVASAVPGPARGQDVNANWLRPSPHPDDIVGIRTSAMPGRWQGGAALWATYNLRPLTLRDGDAEVFRIVEHQVAMDFAGHVAVWDFIDVGLVLPVLWSQGDTPPPAAAAAGLTRRIDEGTLGDLRLSLKGAFLRSNAGRSRIGNFGVALAEEVGFPTATNASFVGDSNVTSTTTAVVDWALKGWRVALNVGVRVKETVRVTADQETGHQLLFGVGLAAPILCGTLDAIGTMEGRGALDAPFADRYDRGLDFLAGLRARLGPLDLVAAAGGAALKGFGSPPFRALVSLAWNSGPRTNPCVDDTDGDGLLDPDDRCPDKAGPVALGGCPDRDGDGIPDRDDRCPDDKGPPEHKGCPDTDGDGIPDVDDACPQVKGIEKFKGCPDRDGDGIPDAEDRCPDQPGPATLKGCPDRDGDAVADVDDACPGVPGLVERKGCPAPKAVLTEKKIEILDVVHFEFGKAVIRPESFPLLRDVAQVLRDNPGVKQVRVEGHTDDVGNDRKNLTLSQQRAESVRDFLVREGIDAARLAAKGYGETKPVATNKTDEGRAKNRRVEFVILSGPGDVQAK